MYVFCIWCWFVWALFASLNGNGGESFGNKGVSGINR